MQSLVEATYSETLYRITPRVTVVIGTAWPTLGEAEKTLLTKILSAVKLSLDSVTIRYQQKLDLSAWAEKPAKVLCFTAADGLPKNELLPAGQSAVVVSLPLAELVADDDAKKKLWSALKQMFA
ncbi:MAG: hypothetical protein ACKOE6_07720 [Flammeovirgaceae bacterium]